MEYLPLVLCSVAAMVVGFLWYGPLFAKPWMKLAGITKEDIEKNKTKMGPIYATALVSNLVMAYILNQVLMYAGAGDLAAAVWTAVMVWLGFVATTMWVNYAFVLKPRQLYLIDSFHHLTVLVVMSVILTLWK